MSEIDYDILNLRCWEVPREESHVEGCDCTGGGEIHLVSCSLWQLPPDVVRANIAAAEARVTAHTAELNRRLHAALRPGRAMTDFEIPAAMVEVGKAALGEYLTALALASPDERDEVCDRATTYVLAAALSVCEVEERWRVHSIAASGNPEDDMFSGEYESAERCRQHIAAFRRDDEEFQVIERKLEIWTPAEQVDTEEADRG